MQQLLNTLYITTPNAYVRLEGETLCIEVEGEKKAQIPLHHLSSLVCFGDVILTPASMHRCAADGRSIVYLDRNGMFRARVEGPVSGNILLRLAQHKAAYDLRTQIDIARSFLAGKLKNCRQVLLRAARESISSFEQAKLDATSRLIATHIKKLLSSQELESLRGYEGDAAKNYFQALNFVIKQDKREGFELTERSRRPPLDAINALLSFLYSILLNDCRSAIEGVGLDPQLGFLHSVRPGRAALALDLMEELRPVLADRAAITLINLGQISLTDFDHRPGGAVYLNDKGRKTVLAHYQTRKQDEILHPLLAKRVQLGLIPHVQARLLARRIRGDIEHYIPFLIK